MIEGVRKSQSFSLLMGIEQESGSLKTACTARKSQHYSPYHFLNRLILLAVVIVASGAGAIAEGIEGFTVTGQFREQIRVFKFEPDVTATMIAPSVSDFNPRLQTTLIIYALPNGNTTEQTIGKALGSGDDWHFDIQHIGAQMRLLRVAKPGQNLVIAYLETAQKSWPAWRLGRMPWRQ